MRIPKGTKFDIATGRFLLGNAVALTNPNGVPPTKYDIELGSMLDHDERGVVIPSPSIFEGSAGRFHMRQPDGVDFTIPSSALLFFDKIDSPRNLTFSMNELTDDYLESKGIVTRTQVKPSESTAEAFNNAPFEVLEERLRSEPGAWSIWQWPHKDDFAKYKITPEAGFRLSLESSLIVPDITCPYDDALEFKDRYRKELRSLRHHIEKLARKISMSGFDEILIRVEKEEFREALEQYLEASRKSNIITKIASLDVTANWSGMVSEAIKHVGTVGLGATAGTQILGLDLKTSFAWAGMTVLGQISATSSFGLKKGGENPFAYRVKIMKNFK